MKQLSMVLAVCMLASAAVPALAQRQRAARDSVKQAAQAAAIPADARPPKGMCRIWIDGVPAAQQPAASDCSTAVRNRPANARVIFGDEYSDTSKTKTTDKAKLPPNVKGFTDLKPVTPLSPKRPPLD